MAADVRQSKDFSLFSFLAFSPLPFPLTDEGKDTPRGITRRTTGPIARMTDRPNCDQNLFSTFRFFTSCRWTLSSLGYPSLPTFVGRRGLIGAGERLQVGDSSLCLLPQLIWLVSFILCRFFRLLLPNWAVVTFFFCMKQHMRCA